MSKSEFENLYQSFRRHYENAFPLQTEMADAFARLIPAAHDGVVRAAVGVQKAGQALSGNQQAIEILRDISTDLSLALKALDQTSTIGQAAITEAAEGVEIAGVALMELREHENDPMEAAQSSVVMGMIAKNNQMIASNHGGTLAAILEGATDKALTEAIGGQSVERLRALSGVIEAALQAAESEAE
jgi:hypothetical protein